MPLSTFVLNNADLDFMDRIVGRLPAGPQVLDVVLSECRSLQPQDWTACSYQLKRQPGQFELQLHQPSNAQQFRLDILHDGVDAQAGLPGLEVLTARRQPLDDAALAAFLQQRSITFVGCARQCVDALDTTVRKLASLGAQFGRWQLIVFENDSTDGTPERLQALAAEFPISLIQAPACATSCRSAPRAWPMAATRCWNRRWPAARTMSASPTWTAWSRRTTPRRTPSPMPSAWTAAGTPSSPSMPACTTTSGRCATRCCAPPIS